MLTKVVNNIPSGINKYHQKSMLAIKMFGSVEAAKLRAHMKIKRPWTDRSNAAKLALDCKFEIPSKDIMRFVLTQGVEYGIWLETCNEKRYAILEPTVILKGPEVLSNMNMLLEKLGDV